MATEASPLDIYTVSSSVKGLSSVTTVLVGEAGAVVIDPPFLVPDSKAVVDLVKSKTNNPVVAVFVTHHHPDHYFSANPILDAFPNATLYAAPYVCAGIDREYDEKIVYWPSVFGDEVPKHPTKPTPYPYSFFVLPENPTSLVMLLGPVQGDSVDHTLFWLPRERTIICGDAVYARSTHVWVEEVETPYLLDAWEGVLDLIESLKPERIIAGHLESGWEFDAKEDLAHNRKYLKLFREQITNAPQKPSVDHLFNTFKDAFPKADQNLDFFLGKMSNHFGEGGEIWAENRMHNVAARRPKDLEGYKLGGTK